MHRWYWSVQSLQARCACAGTSSATHPRTISAAIVTARFITSSLDDMISNADAGKKKGSSGKRPIGVCARRVERAKAQREDGATTRIVSQFDGPTVGLHNFLNDGEAKPRAMTDR